MTDSSQKSQRENIADIMCIGAQKTSTSWLHHVLSTHPDVSAFTRQIPFTARDKEAHFWDRPRNRGKGVDWYRELLTPSEPSLKSMDFTPEYAFLPAKLIKKCHSLSPSAKVIYIIRDPLSRAVSSLRMHAKKSTNDADPNEHVIRFSDETLEIVGKAKIVEHGSYAANWKRWSKFYSNMLLLNYEDIMHKPREVIDQVFSYLEIDMNKMTDEQKSQFDTRMEKKVWKSIEYSLDSKLLHFLHGLTWGQRNAAEKKFGIKFEEYKKTLADAGC